jgi:hypothetical protein
MIPEHIKKAAEEIVHSRSEAFFKKARGKLLAMKMAEKLKKMRRQNHDNLN